MSYTADGRILIDPIDDETFTISFFKWAWRTAQKPEYKAVMSRSQLRAIAAMVEPVETAGAALPVKPSSSLSALATLAQQRVEDFNHDSYEYDDAWPEHLRELWAAIETLAQALEEHVKP